MIAGRSFNPGYQILPDGEVMPVSVQNDTVLDPFLGTATTSLAAMCAARNSIGYEIDSNFKEAINSRINHVKSISKALVDDRLKKHNEFIQKRKNEEKEFKHNSLKYGFSVMTSQEIDIEIPLINTVEKENDLTFKIEY